MQYQVLMVVKVLEIAVAKAQDLVRSVPLGQAQVEVQVELLLQELVKVLRQALALEQEALQLAQEGLQEPLEGSLGQLLPPLVGLGALPQLEVLVQEQLQKQVDLALGLERALKAQEQERELVQAPLLEVE